MVEVVPRGERVVVRVDFNGHVGEEMRRFLILGKMGIQKDR